MKRETDESNKVVSTHHKSTNTSNNSVDEIENLKLEVDALKTQLKDKRD